MLVPRLGGVLGSVAGLPNVEVSKTPNGSERDDVLQVVRCQVRVAHGHVQRGVAQDLLQGQDVAALANPSDRSGRLELLLGNYLPPGNNQGRKLRKQIFPEPW